MVLSEDENFDGVIIVYDIEKDVLNGVNTPTPIIIYNSYTLDPTRTQFITLTSFEMYGTSDLGVNKLFISNWTHSVFSVEIRVSDYSVIDVSVMNIEELVQERDAYITDRTNLFAISVVNYTEVLVNKR